MLRSGAKRIHSATNALSEPLLGDALRDAYQRIVANAHEATRESRSVLAAMLRRAGVEVEDGVATFRPPGRIVIDGRTVLDARNVVIATGSDARRPGRFSFGDGIVCDSELLLDRGAPPRSLVIIGAEEEGCELGSIYSAFGVEVTIVDRRQRLVRFIDRSLLQVFHGRMQANGLSVANGEELVDVSVDHVSKEPHATLRLSSGRIERCDRLLVLAGRQPRTDGIDLDGLGIQRDDRGFITVGDRSETSVPGVYAVGDVTGYPFRIGLAMHQARAAIHHITGREMQPSVEIPLTVYGIPEASVVGMGEDPCDLLEVPNVVGTAWAEGSFDQVGPLSEDTRLKLVFGLDDMGLLGVQIIGSSASELIHLGSHLVSSRATAEEISGMVFNHPSQSSAYRLAALEALSRAEIGREKAGVDD